jgi:hypothetical protein
MGQQGDLDSRGGAHRTETPTRGKTLFNLCMDIYVSHTIEYGASFSFSFRG